jgi:ribonucleoside-diphosphate reductase alpha chain
MKKDKKSKVEQRIKFVRNRECEIVPFDLKKISGATMKALLVTNEGGLKEADEVAKNILKQLLAMEKVHEGEEEFIPSVEIIQDIVERELIKAQFIETAKAYILYRRKRAEIREEIGKVPEKFKKLAAESKQYFRNQLAEMVYYRSYSRWIEEEGRRETWIETVDRYISFMKENLGNKLTEKEYGEVRESILKQEVMPSMRLFQFAGTAAKTTSVCAYNCSFIAPSTFQDFAEIMYISMCGAGSGWSVESQNIQSLPQIKRQTGKVLPVYVIDDSKEGWCDALSFGMKIWAGGQDVAFDYSKLRPAGARLKTMGGKSSGPEPLKSLLNFVREKMLKRQGRRLTNLDAHDIICKIGDCVVSGGVRRSAMISLSDLDDSEIRHCKDGQFYLTEGQRSLSNNSAVYMEKPSATEFLDEWISLMKSGSGERGIFNRGSLKDTLPARRLRQFVDEEDTPQWGMNPCGEIILQPKQFCNLSEVVARAEDTTETLLRKIRLATIIGTYQATLTNFPYISKEWKRNCERERLLGVSITGQWDSKVVRLKKNLEKLKKEAIKINKIYAKRFNINESTCITCVKPSGTVSQTVDSASGMHPRFAPYYIRRIRISATDSLFKLLKDQGVPYYPEVGQNVENANTFVLEFPVKSPKGAIVNKDLNAIQQLEQWKIVKKHYTEHNPSVTIYVGENEWLEVANWLYLNWEILGGLSFLPRTNNVYQLAPYEEITEKQYEDMIKKFPTIDFSKISTYELADETELKRELACAGGNCEI